jgi:hypothetical protein
MPAVKKQGHRPLLSLTPHNQFLGFGSSPKEGQGPWAADFDRVLDDYFVRREYLGKNRE